MITRKHLAAGLLMIGLTLPSVMFGQNHDQLLAKKGDPMTIQFINTIRSGTGLCIEWDQDAAVYSGTAINYKITSSPKSEHQIFSKTSTAFVYGSGTKNLRFPAVSNLVPKNGTPGVPAKGVYIYDNDQGTYVGNTSKPRGKISTQIAVRAVFRTINKLSTSRTSYEYYFTTAPDGTPTTFTDSTFKDNFIFPTDKELLACNNYYIAYCGDGIVDKKTGDGVTDGQGGILATDTIRPGFIQRNAAPATDEICDSHNQNGAACVNGTAGCCNAACNGYGGVTPSTGSLILNKTLVIEKTYSLNENLQFKINFSNNGSTTLTNVTIHDYLPSSFQYISSEISGAPVPYSFGTGTEGGNLKITYSGFTLAPGANGYVLISAKLVSFNNTLNNVFWTALSNGTLLSGYANKLVVGSSQPLQLTKTIAKSNLMPGEIVGFTLQATNNTQSALSNLSIQDIWPSNGCAYFTGNYSSNIAVNGSQNGNISTWTFPTLGVGQTITITFNGQIKSDSNCAGTHTNTGTITYTDPTGTKSNSATASFNVAQITAYMGINKRVVQQGYAPNENVVYEIYYYNSGSVAINGFKIIDIRPDALNFISATPRPRSTTERPLTWDFSNTVLLPGQSGKIKVTGSIKNNIQ